jgi:hypothetical protein
VRTMRRGYQRRSSLKIRSYFLQFLCLICFNILHYLKISIVTTNSFSLLKWKCKKKVILMFGGHGWTATHAKRGTKRRRPQTLDPPPFRGRFERHNWRCSKLFCWCRCWGSPSLESYMRKTGFYQVRLVMNWQLLVLPWNVHNYCAR